MPRTWGESSCSTVWCMRCRPSARTVSLWRWVLPSGLRTKVMRSDLGLAPWVSSGLWLSILLSIPERRHVPQLRAAAPGFNSRALELFQGAQRGIDHVQHIGAAERLGQDVAHPHRLQDGAHAAAGNDAGAGRGRLEQHLRAGMTRNHLVRDGGARQVDALEVGAGAIGGLANGVWHNAALADADSHPALVVADHHHAAEGETPAALDDFGDARNVNYALVKLFATLFVARAVVAPLIAIVSSCHVRTPICLPPRLQPLPSRV